MNSETKRVRQTQMQYKDHVESTGSGLITVTEWQNGEGWDVVLNDFHFSMSYSARDALVATVMALDVEEV